ncbi:hypothetical protein TYRP_003742, partial [Tyrophagus putrescentiae]
DWETASRADVSACAAVCCCSARCLPVHCGTLAWPGPPSRSTLFEGGCPVSSILHHRLSTSSPGAPSATSSSSDKTTPRTDEGKPSRGWHTTEAHHQHHHHQKQQRRTSRMAPRMDDNMQVEDGTAEASSPSSSSPSVLGCLSRGLSFYL